MRSIVQAAWAAVVLVGLTAIGSWLSFGCTDAQVAQIGALGSSGHIVCYSGGKVIFEGDSTGKIATEQGSDGWFFNDAATNKLVRVSGQCVITQK